MEKKFKNQRFNGHGTNHAQLSDEPSYFEADRGQKNDGNRRGQHRSNVRGKERGKREDYAGW